MGKSGLIGDFRTMSIGYFPEPLSGKIIETLDNDVQDILNTCLKEVHDILDQHRDLFEHFSQTLLKKEELEYDEIQDIFAKFNVKPLSGRLPPEI